MTTAWETKLKPLRRSLGTLWILGWTVCVVSLGLLAVLQKRSLDRSDLDTQLSVYATATYGLSWFDAQGNFHDEVLRLDQEIMDAPFDIWVVEPGPPAEVLWKPPNPRFERPDLESLARQVLDSEASYRDEARTLPGTELRLQAAQVFQEGHGDIPRAAVLVLGDAAGPGLLTDPFVVRLAGFCLLLLLAGYALGLHLARRSLRPVIQAFEEREKFLAAAAHELRTPLCTLKAIAESATDDDTPKAEALQRINRLADNTSLVVDDLLLFARLDSGTAHLQRQRTRLDLLIESVAPEHCGVELKGDEVRTEVDVDLFAILLQNLFQNAERHGNASERGCVLELQTDSLTYRDRGPGFPAEVLEQVRQDQGFVPSQGGVGLGLTVLRMIVGLHGGSVRFDNPPEGGARIEIRDFSPHLR